MADDHRLFLDAVSRLLEPEFELIGAVEDGKAALTTFEQLRPDALLLDIGLPVLNGIEVTRRVKRNFPDARVLFVTMHCDTTYLDEAFRAGGSGYVVKQAAAGELVDAVKSVLRGRQWVSPRLCEMTQKAAAANGDLRTNSGSRLTARQREVLQLLAEGNNMKQIAGVLGISVRTVEFHKQCITQELGLRTIAELTRYAVDHRIVV